MIDKNLNLEKTIEINASLATVWDALTNPAKIKLYLFGTEVLTNWEKGSRITFRGEYEGQEYKDGGTILAIEPEKLLQYTYWSSMSGLEDTANNYSTITFSLEYVGTHTALTLTQKGFANQDARDHAEQNWTMVLEKIKEITTSE